MAWARWKRVRRAARARRKRERKINREVRRLSRGFDRQVANWLSPVPVPVRRRNYQLWAAIALFVIALGAVFAATTLAAMWFSPLVAGAVPTLTIASAAAGAAVARARARDDHTGWTVRGPGYAKATDETTDL